MALVSGSAGHAGVLTWWGLSGELLVLRQLNIFSKYLSF
jgi:hypothetical protein